MAIRLPSADKSGPSGAQRIRVLVVDDGKGATACVRDILADAEDLVVTSARSASDAESLLSRGGFEAAILEPRFWEGDQGYLRPVIEDEAHHTSPIVVGTAAVTSKRGKPQHQTIDEESMRAGSCLADLIRRTVVEARSARRKQTMLRWLEREANTDELTGLNNRKGFEEELRETCATARIGAHPVGLLLMNVVGTGGVNAAHGQEAGDQMIRRAAAGLTRSVRGVDFSARLGDDDFAVILSGADIDLVRRVARRITHEIERMNTNDWETELPLSVTFGVASGVGVSAKSLLSAAEKQLGGLEHGPGAGIPPRMAAPLEDDDGPSVA
jgi:diguanylate cyclase (GGDEF)-like protein